MRYMELYGHKILQFFYLFFVFPKIFVLSFSDGVYIYYNRLLLQMSPYFLTLFYDSKHDHYY